MISPSLPYPHLSVRVEQELKARNIQHARNLYDRAVTLLPRVDQMWLKFVYLEELLQNIAGARQVFERWMKWEPDDKGQSAPLLPSPARTDPQSLSLVHLSLASVHQGTFSLFGGHSTGADSSALPMSPQLELRYNEFDRASMIYERWIGTRPEPKNWIVWSRYEEDRGKPGPSLTPPPAGHLTRGTTLTV